MTNPTYKKGVGQLAVNRYDFQKHIDGESFQHKAKGIISETQYSQFNNAIDLQSILDALSVFVDDQNAAGQGFVTVGDGYDTWHAADGSTNYDNTIPALDTILNPIFQAIINNTALSQEHERIRRGGVVFIKAGTYIVKDTIEVPPGISIVGEGWGTKIVNAIRLNTASLPPQIDGPTAPKPVFTVKADTSRSINDGGIDTNYFMFSRETKFINLLISDNFVENTIIGDVYYKLPQNTTGDNPLILQEAGSSLTLLGVTLTGRVTFSSGTTVSSATRYAVELDVTTGITNGTILNVMDCFIDGFSTPIKFDSLGEYKDHLNIQRSKIRTYGYLSGNTTHAYNTFCIFTSCNANISNNYLYGNNDTISSIAYITLPGSPPATASRPRILVANNDITINRANLSAGVGNTLIIFRFNTAFSNEIRLSNWGNNIDSTFQVNIDEYSLLNLGIDYSSVGSTHLSIGGSISHKVSTTSSNYPMQANDYMLLVNTSGGAVTVTLPTSPYQGHTVVIKDQGSASTYNITLSSAANIEGVASSYVISGDYAVVKLTYISGAWWITG